MQLHDSLEKKAKAFPASASGPISIYACGPTVYHYAHIGNLRTFLTVDLLRRFLEWRGREVKLVMNITDVGHMLNDADVGQDKMEAAAAKEGKRPEEIAAFYERAFFADLEALHFKKEGTTFPRATENIAEMAAMIEALVAQGKAYVTPKGDIYYSVAAFQDYGKLSGNAVEDLVAGARVEVKDDKRHPADFALWICNPNHVMQWTGPLGIQGYPGWHIECSAMARRFLGPTLDLHCGGEDLRFPHHECEIAQSEGANGKEFSRHWLHVTYLVVDGEKMSKSKGNFYTLADLLAKGYSADAVRWLLLSAHYRTQLNFTLEGLDAAEQSISYFRNLREKLKGIWHKFETKDLGLWNEVQAARKSFEDAMADDLNVSAALSTLHGLATTLNRSGGVMDRQTAEAAVGFLDQALDKTFGIDLSPIEEEVPADVLTLREERANARARKDFAESDRLRDAIATAGWMVEDTKEGQKLRKA